ncbi:hypothetical protein RN001_000327 [Aquatica leii]|uniref:Uncharacterized protein n=1 Tax=Aquatica leii TaxID=1421715 RepID=A0AAN7SC60_9COLE|nr:hypothetical protein RN001_000327 [Aquatica leii]
MYLTVITILKPRKSQIGMAEHSSKSVCSNSSELRVSSRTAKIMNLVLEETSLSKELSSPHENDVIKSKTSNGK